MDYRRKDGFSFMHTNSLHPKGHDFQSKCMGMEGQESERWVQLFIQIHCPKGSIHVQSKCLEREGKGNVNLKGMFIHSYKFIALMDQSRFNQNAWGESKIEGITTP